MHIEPEADVTPDTEAEGGTTKLTPRALAAEEEDKAAEGGGGEEGGEEEEEKEEKDHTELRHH